MEKKNYSLSYSFEARLHQTDDVCKNAFNECRTLFEGYGLKFRASFKKIRVYKGRELYAFLVFRGKKLAICFAINPKDLEGSKYKGKDISSKKLYQKTPFEFKITSARKVTYIEDLIDMMLVDKYEYKEKKVYDDKFRYLSDETMIERGLIKKIYKKDSPVEEREEIEYVPFVEEGLENNSDVEVKETSNEEVRTISYATKYPVRHIKLDYHKSRKNLATIDIKVLNDEFENGDNIDIEILKLRGLVDSNKVWLKVLGNSGLNKSLNIFADKYSKYAKSVILLNNGKAE